ncbi:MAG TPA: amidohydrolase, partial [Vicinamibacteria bacterium]|nr:amidohydrolase [Vicinamibacteria bacterium]
MKHAARPSLLVAALLALLGRGAPAAEKADRIFVNGRIWTGDPARPRVEALAVRGPTIIAVGRSADIRGMAEKATDVVDLKGRFVCPGFIDAHLHFMGGSLALEALDLHEAGSLAEIEKRIKDYARAHADSAWVTGEGWAYGAFAGGMPRKEQLDAVLPDRPAYLTSYDGHTAWVNSVALSKAKINRSTEDPSGGAIQRDAQGEPTGVLKESAKRLVSSLLPAPAHFERYRAFKKGLDLAASYGLTSVHQVSFSEEDLKVMEQVLAESGLKVRFYASVPMVKDPTRETLDRYEELRRRHQGRRLRFGAVKGFVDGVVESRTAAMFEPYAAGGTGLPNWTQEDLDRTVALYDKAGYQVFLHAIGDRGIAMALSAYESAARANGTSGRRHRIEHVEVPRPEDLPRFKALGVIASTQALFAHPDQNHLGVYVPTLGPARAARAMPFKAIDDAGILQAFGSDWPVYTCEVLRGIYCAATRMTREGTPPGGWEPGNRITAEAALRHFTRDAAH